MNKAIESNISFLSENPKAKSLLEDVQRNFNMLNKMEKDMEHQLDKSYAYNLGRDYKGLLRKIDNKLHGLIKKTLSYSKILFKDPRTKEMKRLNMKIYLAIARVYMCKHSKSFFAFVKGGLFDWFKFKMKFNAVYVKDIVLLANQEQK